MDADLCWLGLREVRDRIARRELSPAEVVAAAEARLATVEPALHAIIWRNPRAGQLARRPLPPAGRPASLFGVPVTVKDLLLTHDAPTTAGSRTFGEGLRGKDAVVVRRLRRAGAILLAKTNLHEIAMGVTSANEHFGAVRNPWDPSRSAGGSSGGSAAALAAGVGYGSVGTDTRGSIRIPAACCGVTGLKPSHGLLSTEGVIPLSWSLDHVGPMARSAEDVALLLAAMHGGRRFAAAIEQAISLPPPERLRIGVLRDLVEGVDPEIERAFEAALRVFYRAGHALSECRLARPAAAHAASGVITSAEALAYHQERLATHPEGFGATVRARLARGRELTAVQLVDAQREQAGVRAEFEALFREHDLLFAPTLPGFAPRVGEETVRTGTGPAGVLESFTRWNALQNLAGVPALSFPGGLGTAGLPVGLQLSAAWRREALLLGVAAWFQRTTPWHQQRPGLTTG